MTAGALYVIGEHIGDGPVKIGMTYDAGGRVGRGGLNTGNWRKLVPLCTVTVDETEVRWREWLTQHRLRHRHVRGEWFDVRDLAGKDWEKFLDDVANGTAPDLYDLQLGVDDHQIEMVRQPDAPRRHFLIHCSCGDIIDGQPGRTLPSALTTYATDHLHLAPRHPIIDDLRVEPQQRRFTINAYEP